MRQLTSRSPTGKSWLLGAFRVGATILASASASELMARATEDIDIKTQSCGLGYAASALVGSQLYVDGGVVWYNNGSNYQGPNTTKRFTVGNIDEIPITFLERPPEIPEVFSGSLWAYNETLYVHQGSDEANDKSWPGWNPIPNGTIVDFWKYDIESSKWGLFQHNPQTISGTSVPRMKWSTSIYIESLAKAYLIGGEIINSNGGYLQGMMIYNMKDGSWEQRITRAWSNWASAVAVHVPVEDRGPGYIFAFAGRSRDDNGLNGIDFYDLDQNIWGEPQMTTFADSRFPFPEERQKPCAVVARAKDGSSYNVYVFGGKNLSGTSYFNDVWVLSIPSFKWFRVDPGSAGAPHARESMLCHIVGGGRKMLVYGGISKPFKDNECDQTGVHVYDMTTLQWEDVYDPDAGEYEVPKVIYDVIGGGPQGGANLLPVGDFADPGMKAKFTKLLSTIRDENNINSTNDSSTTSTTATPAPNGEAHSHSSLSPGVIAAIVIGSVIAVVILILALFYLRKRAKTKKAAHGWPWLSPAELPGPWHATHELHPYSSSPGAQELHTPTPFQPGMSMVAGSRHDVNYYAKSTIGYHQEHPTTVDEHIQHATAEPPETVTFDRHHPNPVYG